MRKYLLPVFLLGVGLESALAVAVMLRSLSEAGAAVFLGLSASRLALTGGVGVVALLGVGGFFWGVFRPESSVALREKMAARLRRDRGGVIISLASAVGAWLCAQLVFYAPEADEPVVRAVLARLLPVLILGAVVLAELLLVLWLTAPAETRLRWRPLWRTGWLGLAGTGALWWVGLNGWGYMETVPGSGEFRPVEAPLLGAQLALAVVVVALGTGLWRRLPVRLRREGAALVGVWLLAFVVWNAAPLKASWFADPPRPPNYTWSPNSDAHLYEATGQSLLAGAGLRHPQWGAAVLRPLYSGLLALLHLLGGPGYEDILPFQVAILALAPVLLYAVTRRVSTPAAGALAALLMILRERNALMLADTITVSHAKVLMADLPAMLGMLLAVWLALAWLRKPEDMLYPLLLGGTIGAFLLVRLESFIAWGLLPLVGVALLRRRMTRLWLRGAALAVVAFVVFLAPWVWRNWRVTGQVYLVSPGYEQAIFERLFGARREAQPATGSHLAMRVLPDGRLLDEIGGEGYRLRHFVNSQSDLLLYLPAAPQAVLAGFEALVTRKPAVLAKGWDAEAYVRALPYWWNGWDGHLAGVSLLPLWLNLTLLLLGLVVLWRRNGFVGLLPALLALLYVAALAWIGRSGGRWLLEVDWVSMMGISVGLVEIGGLLAGRSIEPREQENPSGSSSSPRALTVSLGLVFLLGLALPLAEQVIPQRYTQEEAEKRLAALLSDGSGVLFSGEKAALERMLLDGASVWLGRALYPRYFAAGDGMEGMGGGYKKGFARLEWYLTGNGHHWSVLPYAHSDVQFPHGAEVLAIGEPPGSLYMADVFVLVIYSADEAPLQVLWREPSSKAGLRSGSG